jgi:myxalamid-type polyketide synthase MxaB
MRKALTEIRELRTKVSSMEGARSEPIAVIGMGCRFPSAPDPAAFWDLLVHGVDAVTEVPRDRWDMDAYYDPDPDKPGKVYTKAGAFLKEIEGFDPGFFGISPREAASMDPQQRLLLEVSWEALENAGVAPERLQNSPVGVFVGIGATDHNERAALQGPAVIDAYNGTGASNSVASGRLSYLLGVRGPSLAVDTACSSSLASVHLAVESLRSRESDIALAGGVSLMMAPDSYVTLSKARMLSPDGRCKTFDASANGYVRGEGCGMLALKRLSNALADNDNILAVIRGSALNHNGRSSGLTVPSGPAQQALIRQALRNAGIKPVDVGFIEAHGTGTAVGDPIEVGAFAGVFADRSNPLLIGSVKSNVGHLEFAAGICGLIKAILCVRHEQIPGSLHFKEPNPHLDWKNLLVRVVTELTPWPNGRRIAGVSSYGFGGTNAFTLVEEPPALAGEPAAGATNADRPLHVLALSAKSDQALHELAGRYAQALDEPGLGTLADVCFTANAGRSHFEHRLVAPASSKDELRQRLRDVAAGEKPVGVTFCRVPGTRPRIAMLFTGQGSQYVGMGRELFDTQPTFRRTLKQCDEILRGDLECPLLEVLYPPDQASNDQGQRIHETANTQPALFALEYALAQLWQSWGIRPDFVTGHSAGEYAAACVAGVFSLEDGLRLIADRARLMQALPQNGGMIAVRAPEELVERRIAPHRQYVSIAAVNGARDVVISGERGALEAIAAQLQAEGVATQPLAVSHAFHSPLIEPILADFERTARAIRYNPPRLGLISNLTGKVAGDEVTDPAYWVRHIRQPVLFAASMRALTTEGCDVFLEVGPQPTLLGLGRHSVPNPEAAWLPSLRSKRGDWQQMVESLAVLYVRGADINWAGFDQDYRRRKVELPTYPFDRQAYRMPRANDRSRNGVATHHPLVDTLVQSPLVKETVFATPLSTAVYPYLSDHRIFGDVVAPASCYLAMMCNGAARLGHVACRLEDVFFVAPLVLADNEERTLQAVLDPEGAFRIISLAADESVDGMMTHVSGRWVEVAEAVLPSVSLKEMQERCTKAVDVEALAAGLEGIEFGPSFQWIDSLWTGPRESLARLRWPEAVGNTDGYWVHPGFLDACFQTAGATLQADSADQVLLPLGVISLELYQRPAGTEWWCHARQVGDSVWDVQLFDAAGTVIAEIHGFEMRRASSEAFQNRRMADWMYHVEWQQQALTGHAGEVDDQGWLIVGDGSGLGDELAQHLKARGQAILVTTDAGKVPHLLLSPQARVIYLSSGNEDGDAPAAAAAACLRLLELVHILTRAGIARGLCLVTHGCQAVGSADSIQLAPAPIWGMARTLQLELPALKCVCIDLPARPTTSDIDALLSELQTSSSETQIAYRGGERYVARLVRHRTTRVPEIAGPFRLQLTEYGSPDQLRMVPLTRRSPGPGEVEIEVKAAALNFRDVLIALGMLKEYYTDVLKIDKAEDVRLGFDCAGTIAAVCEGETVFKVGDEVMASAAGSSASFLTLPRTDVVHKPAGISFETASTIPTAFLTAHYGLLQLGQLKPGERVLIHAAAGGVGQAAVQLAQAVGAEIFATASPGKWDFLKSQGIQHVMNSRTLDFADEIMRLTGGEGVDVVLNSLTGEAIEKSFDVLKPGGRFVEIGKLGIWTPEQAAQRHPEVAYHTFDLDRVIDQYPLLPQSTLGQVREWFEAGRLRPLPQRVFGVQDAAEAYRFLQQTRHVGKVVLTFTSESSPALLGDGSYLITGGLGALGLKVAEYLVERGARHLVLAGRSVASPSALETVERLRSAGASVTVVQADVSDEKEVARLIAACQSQAPLRGIVHAAGVLDDGVFEKQTAERFARVMAPKVHGAWHLHRRTQELPLDFFVCFSSIASLLGSAGQSNYAAANAFLDALAHYRRSRGLPGLSINWGPWAEVGMAANLSLAGSGVDKIAPADGMQVFGELLKQSRRSGIAQMAVMRVNWPQFQRGYPAGQPPPFLSALVRHAAPPKKRSAASDEFLRKFHATAAEQRMPLLEDAIHDELVEVLKLEATRKIAPTQPWADLGLDSLMMVELKNRLEGTLRITLPVERLVRDISTRSLATYIFDKLDDAAPPDTDGAPAGSGTETKNGALSSQEDFEKAYQLSTQIPQMFVTAEKQQGRQILVDGRWRYDFASCNYLGLDFHPDVMAAVPPALAEWGVHPSWTRAVASPRIYNELERELAALVGAPLALVFPSISLLHIGVLPILAGYEGVILKDTEAHHSIHEGCLRAQANGVEWQNFPHSDIDDLERKLKRFRPGRTKIIATDGVYSMGSSHPPLIEYVRLAKDYNALLYVDDAHGFGIIGEKPDAALPYGYRGNGMVRHLGLDYCSDRIVYVAGLSKSYSSYAAFVTCFDEKMKWNLESSGPFVFSGPTCVASLASALAGIRVNACEGDQKRRYIYNLTHRFVTAVRAMGFEVDNGGFFPIVGVVVGDFDALAKACQLLWENDILITPAMYPAVPMERNLVRFSITAANTEAEVDHAIRALEAVRECLNAPGNGAKLELQLAHV